MPEELRVALKQSTANLLINFAKYGRQNLVASPEFHLDYLNPDNMYNKLKNSLMPADLAKLNYIIEQLGENQKLSNISFDNLPDVIKESVQAGLHENNLDFENILFSVLVNMLKKDVHYASRAGQLAMWIIDSVERVEKIKNKMHISKRSLLDDVIYDFGTTMLARQDIDSFNDEPNFIKFAKYCHHLADITEVVVKLYPKLIFEKNIKVTLDIFKIISIKIADNVAKRLEACGEFDFADKMQKLSLSLIKKTSIANRDIKVVVIADMIRNNLKEAIIILRQREILTMQEFKDTNYIINKRINQMKLISVELEI